MRLRDLELKQFQWPHVAGRCRVGQCQCKSSEEIAHTGSLAALFVRDWRLESVNLRIWRLTLQVSGLKSVSTSPVSNGRRAGSVLGHSPLASLQLCRPLAGPCGPLSPPQGGSCAWGGWGRGLEQVGCCEFDLSVFSTSLILKV